MSRVLIVLALLIACAVASPLWPMCRETDVPLHEADYDVSNREDSNLARKISFYEPSDSPIVLMNPQYPHNSKSGPWEFISSINAIDPFAQDPFSTSYQPSNYSDPATYPIAARRQMDQIMFMAIAACGASSGNWKTDILRTHVFTYRNREILEASIDQLRKYTVQMEVPPVLTVYSTATEMTAEAIGGFLINIDFGPFVFSNKRAEALETALKCNMGRRFLFDPLHLPVRRVRAINSASIPIETGFSHGVLAWNTLVTSSFTGTGNTAYAQAISSLTRMYSIVTLAGGQAKNIMQIVGHIPDSADTDEVIRGLKQWATSVGLTRLPTGYFTIGQVLRKSTTRVEFECTAFIGDTGEDIIVGNNPSIYRNASLWSHFAATPGHKRVFGGPAYPTINSDWTEQPELVTEPDLADWTTFDLQAQRALVNLGGIAAAAHKDITDMQWFFPLQGPEHAFFPYFNIHNAVTRVFNRTGVRLQARSESVGTGIPTYAGGSGNGALSGAIYSYWGIFVDLPNRALRSGSSGNPAGLDVFNTCENTDIASCPSWMTRDYGARVSGADQRYYPADSSVNHQNTGNFGL